MLRQRMVFEFGCDHCGDVWLGGTDQSLEETWRHAVEYGGWSQARTGPVDQRHWCRVCTCEAAGAPTPFMPMCQSPHDNDMICHLIEANEGFGEALVAINLALGLPASTSAKKTAARAAELLSQSSG